MRPTKISSYALFATVAVVSVGCEVIAGIRDISWSGAEAGQSGPEASAPGDEASTPGDEASAPGRDDGAMPADAAFTETPLDAAPEGAGNEPAGPEASGLPDAQDDASDGVPADSTPATDAAADVSLPLESGTGCGNFLPRTTWATNPGTTTSDNTCGPNGLINMFDGVLTTRWSTGRLQAPSPKEWLQVDLGCPQTFSELVLDASNDAGDYPRGYTVEVSSDLATWTLAASATAQAARTSITFPTTTARYIRVTQTGSANANFWSVDELNVCGATSGICPSAPAPYARTGWATQPATTASDDAASLPNMFDGSLATRWTTNRTQVTTPPQWVEVDMGVSQPLSQVVLETFDDCNDYPRGYLLQGSSNNATWSQLASGVGSSPLTRIAFATTTARYIKITQTGTSPVSFWSVDDLLVYP